MTPILQETDRIKKMTPVTLNRSILESLIKAALTAPSGDNCQPFTFEWDGQKLRIRHQEERGRHFLNIHNCASLITLGMSLELLSLKASEFGLRAEVALTPQLGGVHSEVWTEVQFYDSTDIKRDPLVDWIDRRFTDRHPYQGGALSDLEQSELGKIALNLANTRWVLKGKPFDAFIPLLRKCDNFIWQHVPVDKGFFRWFIFSQMERLAQCAGIYWKELGISWLETIPLRLMKKWPSLQRVFWLTGLKGITENVLIRNLNTSAGLICFSTSAPDLNSLVNVGRESIRLWIKLNAMGYAVQPMTQSSMYYFCSSQNGWGSQIQPEYIQHFKNTLATAQAFFGLKAQEIPVWCLRFGKSNGQQTSRLSVRRPLNHVYRD